MANVSNSTGTSRMAFLGAARSCSEPLHANPPLAAMMVKNISFM
jgi:hypothetical protein